ncbi:MAG: ABC transporter permease subunit [Synechococcales cyanobacterium]
MGSLSLEHPQNPPRRSQRIVIGLRFVSAGSVLVILLLWVVITSLAWVNPLFVPSPDAVWTAGLDILRHGYKGISLGTHLLSSLSRLLVALIAALFTAIPLGLLSGFIPWVGAVFDPLIEFYRPLPPLAYYTLLVLWLGIEDPSKIALLFLAAFAPLYLAVVAGVQRIPKDRLNCAQSLGASGWQLLVFVIFPSCLPELFVGLRTAIGFAYTTLVAAEMVAAVSGVGWMVLDASKFLRSDVIFFGILLMGGVALVVDGGLRWLQRSQLPWVGFES